VHDCAAGWRDLAAGVFRHPGKARQRSTVSDGQAAAVQRLPAAGTKVEAPLRSGSERWTTALHLAKNWADTAKPTGATR
jgi:hypothetical protein